MPPFDATEDLRAAFIAGLQQLLDDPGLGAYILVLANAGVDPVIFAEMRPALQQRFEEHADCCRLAFSQGYNMDDAPDDLLVFLKLMAIGFDSIGSTATRNAGPWELQFNLLRSFRPSRMSGHVSRGIQAPFNADGFHFNKPFLRKETFWSGRLSGRQVDLLYNKFPFVDLHGLLVPDREQGLPQFLARDYHRYLWSISEELGETLPGVGFGYNGYAAYSSINHLHFQMFVRERPLPVMAPHWTHNGGSDDYPGECRVFDQPDAAWQYLDQLHRQEHPYNLVYLPQRLFCLPRARQGSYQHSPWTSGFAWFEMAGGVVAFNRGDFDSLTADAISSEHRRVSEGI